MANIANEKENNKKYPHLLGLSLDDSLYSGLSLAAKNMQSSKGAVMRLALNYWLRTQGKSFATEDQDIATMMA